MNIGELFVSLGFDVDDTSLKDFNSKIVAGRNEILQMSAAATAAVYALNALFEGSARNALQLKNFTDQTGFSADALQKWQAVIHETNPAIGLDEAANGYKKLAQTLIDIRQGKGNSGALAMLGVTYDPNMTPEMALEQIRAHLQETIAQNGVGFTADKLNSIGIGAGAINALQLSMQQFNTLGDKAVVSPQTIAQNVEYAKTIAAIDVEWNKFKMDFTGEWAGTFINAINQTEAAMKEFHTNISTVFQYIKDNQEVFGPIEVALGALAAFWGIATFPITAAFAGLAFAINEVGRALRGLPTVTGSFLKAEDEGVHTLLADPGKFGRNLMSAMDNLGERTGATKFLMGDKSSAPSVVNQTNHMNFQQKMDFKEIEHFLDGKVDDAHTQLNLGAQY